MRPSTVVVNTQDLVHHCRVAYASRGADAPEVFQSPAVLPASTIVVAGVSAVEVVDPALVPVIGPGLEKVPAFRVLAGLENRRGYGQY